MKVFFSAGGDKRWKTEPLSVERRSKVEWRGGQSQPPWYIFELRIELKKFSSPVPACHRSPERAVHHAQTKVEERCESGPLAGSHSSIPRRPHTPSTVFSLTTGILSHHIPQVVGLPRRRRDTSSCDERLGEERPTFLQGHFRRCAHIIPRVSTRLYNPLRRLSRAIGPSTTLRLVPARPVPWAHVCGTALHL